MWNGQRSVDKWTLAISSAVSWILCSQRIELFVAEMMAAVWALNHFGNFLQGRHSPIYIDKDLKFGCKAISMVYLATYDSFTSIF